MKASLVLCAFAAAAGIAVSASAGGIGGAASYSASVSAPPKIQQAGRIYFLRIVVRNRGNSIRPFCVDFTDDHNSWDIAMPGLSSWDSDTFCLALPARATKKLTARLIPARTGARKMEILIGKAKIYREVHDAIITDDNALSWSAQFVIVN